MMIAVVTGATSGMGRECAIQLWEQFKGLDEIWAIGRRKERLEQLKDFIGIPVRTFDLDLTEEKDLERLKAALTQAGPQVKFLVNAAGFGKIGGVRELSVSDQTGMAELNCTALTAVTSMVLPFMPNNSRILQFASSAAFLPQPGFAVYAATKAYVLSYSRALNRELKDRGISVTAICPGPVKTEFFDIAQTTGEIPLYKQFVMAKPDRVVKKAIRDSVSRHELSVYGWTMKAFYLLTKLLPHRLILDVMERIEYAPKGSRWES